LDLHPKHLDIHKTRGLTLTWADGSTTFYPVAHLRKLSPSAEMRELRDQIARNPLTVLPASANTSGGGGGGPLTITDAQLVGNYALRITFSDGHHTGIYSWQYLHDIRPASPPTNNT